MFKDKSLEPVIIIEGKTYTENDVMVNIHQKCPHCKQKFVFKISELDFIRWNHYREHIQNVMPYFNEDQREILLSGTCPDCWNILFGKED